MIKTVRHKHLHDENRNKIYVMNTERHKNYVINTARQEISVMNTEKDARFT